MAVQQTAEQFSAAAPNLQLPVEIPNAIRFTILMHVATQKPDIANGRRLGAIFDALIGDWDWEALNEPRKGLGHTEEKPFWIIGLTKEQGAGTFQATLDEKTSEYLWDELNKKLSKQSKEPSPSKGPPCQHCGRSDAADDRWNLTQVRAATKVLDRLGRMLGREG